MMIAQVFAHIFTQCARDSSHAFSQLQKSMQALRGKVSGLTSEQGIKVRRIQIRTEDVDNPDQNYARYLHSVVPTLGSPEDKVVHCRWTTTNTH
jgi:hypothetical protein